MRSSVFDKNIHIECPEDFYEMDNNELKKYFASDMLRFGARKPKGFNLNMRLPIERNS